MGDFEARATSILEDMANKAVIEMCKVVFSSDMTQEVFWSEEDHAQVSTQDQVYYDFFLIAPFRLFIVI